MILAIDPGNIESAFVYYCKDGRLAAFGKVKNEELLADHFILGVYRGMFPGLFPEQGGIPVFCEQIRCYGMAVGASILDTVEWSGRLHQAALGRFGSWTYVPRIDIKVHLCKRGNATDTNIRQALIDRFGPPGTKKAPGRLYGVKKDVWAALALAVTATDRGLA
jgi:hypothetical protein